MCLAIPGQVVELVDEQNRLARVEVAGVRRTVNVALLDDAGGGVRRGDWVLIHVGFALSKVDEEEAMATLRLLEQMAVDLTADSAILTALANDIGADAIFSRQVIAYGGAGDALVCFSTSGNSPNVVAALAEARSRGLATVAFVGYDGGRIAADALADHVVVTRSLHVPRIQEAQAAAYHVLRELLELP
jgi:D-sedoheptulose 7-phosphate isomerase